MNKWLYFVGGLFVGIILTIVPLYFIGTYQQKQQQQEQEDNKTTMFEQPGDVIDVKSFKVFQAVDDGTALVCGEAKDLEGYYGGTVYKLTNDEGKYYYDDEIVNVPEGGVVRQIGLYRYTTGVGLEKTVPIIQIFKK